MKQEDAQEGPAADGAPVERGVGRPAPKRATAAAAWFVFGVLWVAGLALGDQIKAAGHDFSGAWAVLYGGMWMLLCMEVRKALLVLWRDEDEYKDSHPGDWLEP
jgi:hypothetical protein